MRRYHPSPPFPAAIARLQEREGALQRAAQGRATSTRQRPTPPSAHTSLLGCCGRAVSVDGLELPRRLVGPGRPLLCPAVSFPWRRVVPVNSSVHARWNPAELPKLERIERCRL